MLYNSTKRCVCAWSFAVVVLVSVSMWIRALESAAFVRMHPPRSIWSYLLSNSSPPLLPQCDGHNIQRSLALDTPDEHSRTRAWWRFFPFGELFRDEFRYGWSKTWRTEAQNPHAQPSNIVRFSSMSDSDIIVSRTLQHVAMWLWSFDHPRRQ